MSKRLIGIILVVICIIAYHLLANDFETAVIWKTSFEDKILSDPVAVSGNYVFLGGNKSKNYYKLFLINSQGQKIAESLQLPNTPILDPIVVDNNVIVADHGKMVRAFSGKDLKVSWEAASNNPFELPPSKCEVPDIVQENTSIAKKMIPSIIQMSGKSLFCFESKTGKPQFDVTLLDDMKTYATDKVLVAIHGYRDIAKPLWKCSAYSLEDGYDLWKLEEAVSPETPLFVKNTCILSTSDDEAIAVDQMTGKILLRIEAKGYIAVKALDKGVILANRSYTNFAYWSLQTGKSWTSNLKKDFVGAVQIGSRLLIADKVSLRCFELDSGIVVWQKDLGDIYGLFPHRNGIFVTYKEEFAARTTYGACMGADSSENLWLAKGSSIFRRPCPTSEGDLLINYDGTIRMLPKPVFKTVYNTTNIDIKMLDPVDKVNKAFEAKTASNTDSLLLKKENIQNQKENKTKNQAIPSEFKPVSDEEAGW